LRREARGRSGLLLRRSVPDLSEEMHSARASVSQCGYNTALDILRAHVPALVVPFAETGEDEQTNRARRLEALGAVRVLTTGELQAPKFADEIRALLAFAPSRVTLDLDGASNTVRILESLHAARFDTKAS